MDAKQIFKDTSIFDGLVQFHSPQGDEYLFQRTSGEDWTVEVRKAQDEDFKPAGKVKSRSVKPENLYNALKDKEHG